MHGFHAKKKISAVDTGDKGIAENQKNPVQNFWILATGYAYFVVV